MNGGIDITAGHNHTKQSNRGVIGILADWKTSAGRFAEGSD